MAIEIPEFDFSSYNPKDPWHFPAQRIVRLAAELYQLATDSRTQCAVRYMHPDQRFTIFHAQSGLAHSLLLGAMHLRSQGTSEEWWELQPEITHSVDRRLMAANNMSLRNLLHMGFVESTLRQLDMAMRQYDQAMTGDVAKKRGLGEVWRSVLQQCELKPYDGLLRLWQLHRDGLSQLGKFFAEDAKDLSLNYGGRNWSFKHRTEINFAEMGFLDDWDFLKFLVVESDAMLHALHATPAMSAIPAIKARYIE